MSDQIQEQYQLAGFDARERGFSRPVVFEYTDGGYQAIFRYETTRVVTIAQATPGAALEEFIRTLQGQGYSNSAANSASDRAPTWVLRSLGLNIQTQLAAWSKRAGG